MLKSMLVKDYMVEDHLSFSPDMEVLDAIDRLLEHRLSGAPVVDGSGCLVGYLSEKDCLKVALNATYYEQPGGPVSQFMTRQVKTLDADSSLADAVELFVAEPYRSYPVIDGPRLVGQLTRREALLALKKLA